MHNQILQLKFRPIPCRTECIALEHITLIHIIIIYLDPLSQIYLYIYAYLLLPLDTLCSLSSPTEWSCLSFGTELLSSSFLGVPQELAPLSSGLLSVVLLNMVPQDNPGLQIENLKKKLVECFYNRELEKEWKKENANEGLERNNRECK